MPRTTTAMVTLRFTSANKLFLKAKAAEARMNMNEYLLHLATNKKIFVAEKLPNLLIEITRIGVNINQVAHVCNSKKTVSPFQVDELIRSLLEVRKLLNQILEEFREIRNHGGS
jgi:hypothetical protein